MKRKFYLFIILPILLISLSACSYDMKEGVYSDGSVVVMQKIYFHEYMKMSVESGEQNEFSDEYADLSEEEQILMSAIDMSKGFCDNMLENTTNLDDLKILFNACESLDDGNLLVYYIFAPGTFKLEKDADVYRYYFKDFIADNELDDSFEDELMANTDFTIFFEGNVISSDIGEINNNQVTFNLDQINEIQVTSEDNNPVMIAEMDASKIKDDKLILNYYIDEKNSIYYNIENISLNTYLNRIEEIWGYDQNQLKMSLCLDNENFDDSKLQYSTIIYDFNCQADDEIIFNKKFGGEVNDALVDDSSDYYQYYLIEIITLKKIANTSWPSELEEFVDGSEIHLNFFNNIIESDLGTIENENELILNWEDIKNINNDSIIKILKNDSSSQSQLTPEPESEPQPQPQSPPSPVTSMINKTIIKNQVMYSNLKGRILLQVESAGEAYYVHPSKSEKFFLGRPDDAFLVMREQGIGISNENLAKIPVSLDNLSGLDTSGDGLPDAFKEALGLDINSADSDGDGYNDYIELLNGYDPLGSGKLSYDFNFAKNQAGRILLQVEKNGEAWYVSPENNKRYFLSRPADAFNVMRNLGLGISNDNLDKMTSN